MTNDENSVGEGEPWAVGASAVVREDAPGMTGGRVYDLEERTARFGEAVIDLLKKAPRGPHSDRLVDQLTGCATSVGANYCETDDAVSKKEFIVNVNRCRKEARESKFFLRMIARALPALAPDARPLWREAHELHLIFSQITRAARTSTK